jgi:hypothetical protein
MSDPEAITSRLRVDSFGSLLLWDSESIDEWQVLDRRRVPNSPDLDEFATLPKSISFRPKPRWTSDSYNFLPNIEEEINACWIVVGRDETAGSAVNGPERPDTAEIKDLQGIVFNVPCFGLTSA